MPTNHYFNNFGAVNEQRLVEDVIVESIKIMGTDAFYLPNDNDAARDLLYGEDPLKKFQSAYPVEIYPENIMEYGGDRELFSKFGLEIKNQMTVILTKRTFAQRVPSSLSRPREGDLIYVPFLNGTGELYEIKFTNQTKDFFMLGRKTPYFYELELEKFKYSQEVIDTGIPDIDEVVTNSSYQIDLSINKITGNGDYVVNETVYQSNDNTLANAYTYGTVQEWNANTGTLSVSNISGEFANNIVIVGDTSNTHYSISAFDPMMVTLKNEPYDNKIIEDESENYVDNTTSNPFGSL
jgi:hypothetical protein